MDDDERDYDLLAEMVAERKRRAAARRRATAWDEPPDCYDEPDEPEAV
jgi:hypothetical protein